MATRRHASTFVAAIAAGLQGVVILVVSKAALGDDDFTPIAQLWAIWAVSAASLNFGTQQWAAVRSAGPRLLVQREGRSVRAIVVVSSVGVGLLALLLRVRVFADSSLWWPALAALLPVGTALVGLNRGQLARAGRTSWLSLVIGGENTLRLVLTILFVLVDASAPWYGIALISGFVVAFIPSVPRVAADDIETGPLISAVGVGLISHALLFGSPLVLAASGGVPSDVVALFLILSVVRAPFVLLQALVPLIAVRFGRDRDRLASTVRTLAVVGGAGAAAAFVALVLIGDLLVGSIFGIRGEVAAQSYGLVGAAAMLSISLSIITVRLVASDVVKPLIAAWSAPVAVALAATSLGWLDRLDVIAAAMAVVHLLVIVIVVALTPNTVPAKQPVVRSRG